MLGRLLLCLAALCGITTGARAWDDFGHMLVAEVAWERLVPATRERVDALLKLNPEYQRWVAGAAAGEAPRLAFMAAATWPDFIKGAPGYVNDPPHPDAPAPAEGYSDRRQHRYWHYVDLPFSPDRTPLVQPEAPNAVTRIVAVRETLYSLTAPDELKSYDLVWLLHLVGDVHQPLHATSRFTRALPKGDQGGNAIKLGADGRATLHAFWDETLGTGSDPAAVTRAAAKLPPAPKSKSALMDPNVWAAESFASAKRYVYAAPVPLDKGPVTLTAAYRANARAEAKRRAELAGERLANVLNAELR